MPRYPRRSAPEPLETNAVPVVLLGTVLWALGGVFTVVRYHHLAHADRGWWLATCVTGVLVGVILLAFERWRRQHRAAPTDPTTGS